MTDQKTRSWVSSAYWRHCSPHFLLTFLNPSDTHWAEEEEKFLKCYSDFPQRKENTQAILFSFAITRRKLARLTTLYSSIQQRLCYGECEVILQSHGIIYSKAFCDVIGHSWERLLPPMLYPVLTTADIKILWWPANVNGYFPDFNSHCINSLG